MYYNNSRPTAAGHGDLPGLHLRGDQRLQPDADLRRRRLRPVPHHVGVLGGRRQADGGRREPGRPDGLRQLCESAGLCGAHRAGVHGALRTGELERGRFKHLENIDIDRPFHAGLQQ